MDDPWDDSGLVAAVRRGVKSLDTRAEDEKAAADATRPTRWDEAAPGGEAAWAGELPGCADDAAAYDDDAIPADGILLQRGGTGPAGEQIVTEPNVQTPPLYVVIHNIKSSDNVGQLIRTAGAFGAREVLVVSAERTARRMRKNLRTFGAHGSDKRVPMRAFGSLPQLIAWARGRGCRVVGVEIDAGAVCCFAPGAWGAPVRPTCVLPGNEGDGLSRAQIQLCDALVYVPQYAAATASLNVNAATACVLSCFAHAAGYAEERRSGAKFEVRDPLHALWKPK